MDHVRDQRKQEATRTQQRRAATTQRQAIRQRLHAVTATIQEVEQARLAAEDERLAAVAAAHQAGVSCMDIAKELGVSRSRAHQLVLLAQARERREEKT
jgi:Homeodomain-like domain